MRFTRSLNFALSGSTVLVLLAGCSGGPSSSPAPLSPGLRQSQSVTRAADSVAFTASSTSVLRPGIEPQLRLDRRPGFADADAAAKTALVVSDAGTNTVVALTATGKTTATISGLNEPQGLAAGLNGDVYIANTGDTDVLVYKNDYKTLTSTLQDPGQYPVGVDINPKSGIVAVTNIISTAGGVGSVSIYGTGKVTPCTTVAGGDFARVYFGAFDGSGNFFVDGTDRNGSTVVGEVSGACKATSIVKLKTSNTIAFPGGVQVTPSGSIVIDDQSGAAIYTYNAPVSGSLGKPIATTPLTGSSDAVTFAFFQSLTGLVTADAGLAKVLVYKYPAGGKPIVTLTGFTQPIGVVAVPSAPNASF